MRNRFKGKDFLAFKDMDREEIEFITDLSLDFKKKWTIREPHEYLKGQVWAALFEKNSTRTRNAFERAAADLGVKVVYLRPDEMQMTRGEPLKDTARILDRYFDGLFIRTFGHEIVEECAKWMQNPVINGLTALEHPTQGIADLMTIKEKKGHYQGLKICYAGNIYNVAYTTMIFCATLGIDLSIACPEGIEPDEKMIAEAKRRAKLSGAKIEITSDFDKALSGADIVYGMSQYSMGQSEEKITHLKEAFKPYQITMEQLKKAKSDAIFMHCLPAHRGEEVTDEVMECDQSVIFDEGENRMHSIKAILAAVAD
ncbi:ornithine carbamoyltransferase [Lactobacillus jensenii]|jgi:ornithine carbamoyltransferase|uniref:Ornithine carbamoyltransferase n=2 Tax=Lactobacillus jensenii TaxID=109790 RepID=A0A5N1IA41_LACJE|nr:ornithine carbamoyltransferase [Lactobacillus jensenii]ERJ43089.1 ornithine carbamoyltransferase [Lactobacillus jensenii MD IIE-70(2)]APT14849.1 ornithine carbamoyltransferase [Lactobacillus jensenii]EEQ24224.1 ornithine carbamoyltransferase [Lactobacillus jensenii 269-3]KAA9234267.1 ornithine carbamoyltransferase [Lactobacillus jensenii]KAA9256913.1 ornithine carbamoyltransferase [Lactobacillus jensenii]